MKIFWARPCVGSPVEFLGNCWEDGGLTVDKNGDPYKDCHGNRIVIHMTRAVKPADAAMIALAYSGGGRIIDDLCAFWEFITGECGLTDAGAAEVFARVRLPYAAETQAEVESRRKPAKTASRRKKADA